MMGTKHDLVVWLRLQPLQRHIYEAFLHSDAVKAALNSSKSPLAALTVLKKVCDHPALLSERATKLVLTGEAAFVFGMAGFARAFTTLPGMQSGAGCSAKSMRRSCILMQ
jgi:SNF2 family DNA or RNA helicase